MAKVIVPCFFFVFLTRATAYTHVDKIWWSNPTIHFRWAQLKPKQSFAWTDLEESITHQMFRTSNLRGNKSLSPGLPWVVMVPCWNISSIVVRTTLRWLEGRFYSSLHSWPQLRGCYQTLNLMCPYLNCYFFDFECDMREVASLFHNPNRIQTQEKKQKKKLKNPNRWSFLETLTTLEHILLWWFSLSIFTIL